MNSNLLLFCLLFVQFLPTDQKTKPIDLDATSPLMISLKTAVDNHQQIYDALPQLSVTSDKTQWHIFICATFTTTSTYVTFSTFPNDRSTRDGSIVKQAAVVTHLNGTHPLKSLYKEYFKLVDTKQRWQETVRPKEDVDQSQVWGRCLHSRHYIHQPERLADISDEMPNQEYAVVVRCPMHSRCGAVVRRVKSAGLRAFHHGCLTGAQLDHCAARQHCQSNGSHELVCCCGEDQPNCNWRWSHRYLAARMNGDVLREKRSVPTTTITTTKCPNEHHIYKMLFYASLAIMLIMFIFVLVVVVLLVCYVKKAKRAKKAEESQRSDRRNTDPVGALPVVSHSSVRNASRRKRRKSKVTTTDTEDGAQSGTVCDVNELPPLTADGENSYHF